MNHPTCETCRQYVMDTYPEASNEDYATCTGCGQAVTGRWLTSQYKTKWSKAMKSQRSEFAKKISYRKWQGSYVGQLIGLARELHSVGLLDRKNRRGLIDAIARELTDG